MDNQVDLYADNSRGHKQLAVVAIFITVNYNKNQLFYKIQMTEVVVK